MGCLHSRSRGVKTKKEEPAVRAAGDVIEIKTANGDVRGADAAASTASAVSAAALANQTSLENKNAVLDDDKDDDSSKANGINIVVTKPANAHHPPGSLVHVIRRMEDVEKDNTTDEEDDVGPLPTPRAPRPPLVRMLTAQSEDGFGGSGSVDADTGDAIAAAAVAAAAGDDSSSASSVEAIVRASLEKSIDGNLKSDSLRGESGSRVVSAMDQNSMSIESFGEDDPPSKRIEIVTCSSVETDDEEQIDRTKLMVPDDDSSDDDEMEPIKEEPELEEEHEKETDESASSKDSSTADIAAAVAATDTVDGPAPRRKSLADSVHDLQEKLYDELELRLGPDVDFGDGENAGKDAAGDKSNIETTVTLRAQDTLTVELGEAAEIKRSSFHVQIEESRDD